MSGMTNDLPAWIVRGARLLRGPCAVMGDVELSPGALTPQEMARACGLHLSFFTHVCSICEETRRQESCYIELDQGCVGFVTRAVCEDCLPVHFAKHLREQAAMDRMVEAEMEEGLLTSSPTGKGGEA